MLHFLMFAAGLAALVVGADLLVRGASRLALSFGISPLVVGLTIVAFGTSAPEMAVSTGAVLNGQTGLAMGNVVGSNIFNVLFILGLSALIAPLVVHVQIIRQEVPILMGASLLLLVLGLDGRISLTDAALLFGLLLAYTVFLVVQSRRETQAAQAEFEAEIHAPAAGAWDARLPVQIALIVATCQHMLPALAHDDRRAGVLAHGQDAASGDVRVLEQVERDELVVVARLRVIEDVRQLLQVCRSQVVRDVVHGGVGEQSQGLGLDLEERAPARPVDDRHAVGGEQPVGGLVVPDGQ